MAALYTCMNMIGCYESAGSQAADDFSALPELKLCSTYNLLRLSPPSVDIMNTSVFLFYQCACNLGSDFMLLVVSHTKVLITTSFYSWQLLLIGCQSNMTHFCSSVFNCEYVISEWNSETFHYFIPLMNHSNKIMEGFSTKVQMCPMKCQKIYNLYDFITLLCCTTNPSATLCRVN